MARRRHRHRRPQPAPPPLPAPLAARVAAADFLDWASLEPFTGHIPTIRLRVPHPKLARLHPARARRPRRAAPTGTARRSSPPSTTTPSSRRTSSRSSAPAPARVPRRPRERRDRRAARAHGDRRRGRPARPARRRAARGVLALVPPVQRRRLRTLLGYEPMTAGGLMSPDFVAVYGQATAAEALDRVRRSTAPADQLAWVFLINVHRRYRGAVSLPDLRPRRPGRAGQRPRLALAERQADADLHGVARTMTDYDLTVVPVLDERRAADRRDHRRRHPRARHPAARPAVRDLRRHLARRPRDRRQTRRRRRIASSESSSRTRRRREPAKYAAAAAASAKPIETICAGSDRPNAVGRLPDDPRRERDGTGRRRHADDARHHRGAAEAAEAAAQEDDERDHAADVDDRGRQRDPHVPNR